MDGPGMMPSAQTLPSPSNGANNGFPNFTNGHGAGNPQVGFTPDNSNGAMANPQSFRSIPQSAQSQLLSSFNPERYRGMLARAESLRAAGWTEQTSGDLASIMALLSLWQKDYRLAEARANIENKPSGQLSQGGQPMPQAPPSANMTPAQLAQLRTQVQAFKQLGKNIPLPLHIQQAIMGAPVPPVAEGGEMKAIEQTVEVLKREEKESGQQSGPLPRALELDKENPIYPYNSISQDPHTYLQPLGRGTAYNASKMQITLVPSLMPRGLDPYLLLEERNRRIDQRVAWRMEELGEALSTVGGGGDGAKPIDGITNVSYNGRPMTWDGQPISNNQVKSVIELRMLKLRDKQKLLREDVVRDMNAASQLPSERADFRRFRSFALRDARQIEEAERIQRLERERQSKNKHLAYVKGICDHGRLLVRSAHEGQDKAKRLGAVVLAAHRNQEKEEAKRLAQLSKDRLKALKADDEAGYRALLDQAKDTRITHLLKRTDTYLDSLANQIKVQKQDVEGGGLPRTKRHDEVRKTQDGDGDEEKVDYQSLTHQIKEPVTEQASILTGGTLKSYQIQGLEWMVSLYNNKLNGILADEMGLGKTIQTLSLITYLIEKKQENGPYLVLVPLSTLTNWQSEFTKWAPTVRMLVLKGDKASRKLLAERVKRVDFQVLLTTYEYVIKEVATLSKIKWHHMIIDEGHRMKNAKSKLALTLNERYSTKYRIILTGTPLQNSIPELWALLNFVLPKVFNSPKSFDEWFNAPFAGTGGEKAEMNEEEKLLVVKGLHKVLRPFLLRRLKKDVEADLPEKTEKIIKVKMSGLQTVLYKHMRDHGKLIYDKDSAPARGAAALQNMVIQLRKICQHPFVYPTIDENIQDHLRLTAHEYYKDEAEFGTALLRRTAGKFELLDRILPKLFATNHKVLIFFQWTSVMNLAEEWMSFKGWKHCRLDGSTPAETRQELLTTFNEPSSGYQAFLLSTRAGGLGLNLQSADTVILYDSDYNPHADQQAQDRAHRIGQKKEVRVLRLVTSNSVEEGIVEIAKRKLALDGQIIQAGKFDGHSSAEERDNFLRTLLDRDNDDQEEEEEPDEDTLNEIISRSEEEMQIFTQMDAERKQQELGGLPRLIAKEELPEAFTREYPPASQLALEVIEEELGRGQRSRNAVNYSENDGVDQFLETTEEDQPGVKRNRFGPRLPAIATATTAAASQANSRAASPAKFKPEPEIDNEAGGGASNRGRKRKEASMTASAADDDIKPKRPRLAGSDDMQLEITAMRAVLNKVNKYQNALGQDIVFPFRNKVPPETPMYYEVVRKPMWVNKIRNQITKYTSMEAFHDDMAQIWENAMIFNKDDSDYYKWAAEIRDYFEQVYAERMAQLEAERAAAVSGANADDEDVAMTPASSTTGGGDDVSYSGASASRPKLKVKLNRNAHSNTASPAPSKPGKGAVTGGKAVAGSSRMSHRVIKSDDEADDQDPEYSEDDE